jgi:hypothetical protein
MAKRGFLVVSWKNNIMNNPNAAELLPKKADAVSISECLLNLAFVILGIGIMCYQNFWFAVGLMAFLESWKWAKDISRCQRTEKSAAIKQERSEG